MVGERRKGGSDIAGQWFSCLILAPMTAVGKIIDNRAVGAVISWADFGGSRYSLAICFTVIAIRAPCSLYKWKGTEPPRNDPLKEW